MCASLSAKGSSRLGRSGVANRGSTLSERRYLRTVLRDSPVRRAISRIENCCRYRQRRMTLNNSMSITPRSPAMAEGERFEHGSVLGGHTRATRVSSQWKSTTLSCLTCQWSQSAFVRDKEINDLPERCRGKMASSLPLLD